MNPLLFAVFIADLEQFLKQEGVRGVSINHFVEILLLTYTGDIAILADSSVNMKKILKAIKKCDKNDIEINIKKSQIIIFKKRGEGRS